MTPPIAQWRPQPSRTTGVLATLTLAFVLAGCSPEEVSWNSKDISGLMPELAFELTDTTRQVVTAEDFSGQIPLLFFGFTSCPDVCPTTLTRLRQAVSQMPAELRDQVVILFVSVDPQRDTPEKLARYVEFFGDRIVGLTADEQTLRQLSKRYRTTFGYGDSDSDGHYPVSHSSAVYVFDARGQARLLVRPELGVSGIREDLEMLAREAQATDRG